MELKVGEYIRSKSGKIDIVKPVKYDTDIDMSTVVFCEDHSYWEEDIVNHSENLIDLIEVNDIVNGDKVIEVRKQDGKIYLMTDYVPQKYITSEIKEILTHELYDENVKKFVL